jgi:hypothetical protein
VRQKEEVFMSKTTGGVVRYHLPRRRRALVLACAALLWLTAAASPAAAADPGLPVISGTDAAAAIVVNADPRCAEPPVRMPELKLRWTVDAAKVAAIPVAADLLDSTEFRVDVSMYRAFEEGRFETYSVRTELKEAASAPSGTGVAERSLVIPNLRPAVYYSTRVLAATPQGWVASETVSFLTPICPVDGID